MDVVSLRTASVDSMTSKPSEDEVSADELVAPVAGATASVFATEDTVAFSDTAIQRKIAPYYRNAGRRKKKIRRAF